MTRIERVKTVLAGGVPDQIPVMAHNFMFAATDALVMGNIDPVNVLARGTPESVRTACAALQSDCRSHSNFVLSSGCDIPVAVPQENLAAFFSAVQPVESGGR